MAEWSNAAVLKTVDLRGSGGSNPSLSAQTNSDDFSSLFLFSLHSRDSFSRWRCGRVVGDSARRRIATQYRACCWQIKVYKFLLSISHILATRLSAYAHISCSAQTCCDRSNRIAVVKLIAVVGLSRHCEEQSDVAISAFSFNPASQAFPPCGSA